MTDAEVEAKFRALVEPRYGKETADAVLAKCWAFEEVKSSAEVVAAGRGMRGLTGTAASPARNWILRRVSERPRDVQDARGPGAFA